MPTSYTVRLLSADPARSAGLVVPGAPGLLHLYGPGRYVVGWASTVVAGALTNVEQSVTFSDPDQNSHISNTSPITFRTCGDHKQEIQFVGLFPLSGLGADRSPSLLDVLLLAPAIAWPGGRTLAEPNSELIAATGALVFTPF